MRSFGKSPTAAAAQIGVFERVIDGIEQGFWDMYMRTHDKAVAHAKRFADYDVACDVVEEAFLELLGQWADLQPEQRNDALLFTIVQRRLVDQRRSLRRFVKWTSEMEETTPLPSPEAASTREEYLALLYDSGVAAMAPGQREAWILVQEQHLSRKEAAAALGISLNTIKTQLYRAREVMEERMRQAGLNLEQSTTRWLLPARSLEANND